MGINLNIEYIGYHQSKVLDLSNQLVHFVFIHCTRATINWDLILNRGDSQFLPDLLFSLENSKYIFLEKVKMLNPKNISYISFNQCRNMCPKNMKYMCYHQKRALTIGKRYSFIIKFSFYFKIVF